VNSNGNRFYLQALGAAGLFVVLLFALWNASGGPASEAEVQNANSTRTAIALTEGHLLGLFATDTPPPFNISTFIPETGVDGSTPTLPFVPSPTNTSLLPQIGTPLPSLAPSLMAPSATPLPAQTVIAQAPPVGREGFPHQPTKAPPLMPQVPVTGIQDPAEFTRWYFARVWRERDYQNLWDNYLTASYKANVGSGFFEDYVGWWNSVERVDVNSVEVIENNGTNAWIRVNMTFHMKDGRVIPNQISDYDFLYDASRGTWMFDYNT